MNIKNNKRRQASVERIRKAFLDLLKTKELSEIKVSKICEMAQINRSTFYANFDGVDGLAKAVCNELRDEVEQILNDISTPLQIEAFFLNLFVHIRDNKELYKAYFKLDNEYITFPVEKFISYENLAKERGVDYRIEFFKNGFNAVVKLWLINGCRESPEIMWNVLLYEYRNNNFSC